MTAAILAIGIPVAILLALSFGALVHLVLAVTTHDQNRTSEHRKTMSALTDLTDSVARLESTVAAAVAKINAPPPAIPDDSPALVDLKSRVDAAQNALHAALNPTPPAA